MTFLPDVNVWVALAVGEHVHHAVASTWFESVGDASIAFCRVTQMALLRLLTNPQIMGKDIITAERAWKIFDAFLSDARIFLAPEPAGLEARWRVTTNVRHHAQNFWTDAYLASFAASGRHTLVTFDRALARREGLRAQLLS